MGTTYTVKVVSAAGDASRYDEIHAAVAAALAEVDSKMSTYREESEISRFNRQLSGEPFALSAETFEVLVLAREVSELTAGAFDVTVGPLVEAWGFGPPAQGAEPSESEIELLRQRVGYRHLELDPRALTMQKTLPQVTCDLSAIAKGYAVDRVAGALDRAGLSEYLIEVGGEIRTRGRNDRGQAWRVAIEQPTPDRRSIHRVLPLSGWSMATSGDYRNYVERDGARLSHTIDPRTGRPKLHRLTSVTVLDRRCARADALATALMVLGPEAGYALSLEHDLPALFLIDDGAGAIEERTTPAFDAVQNRE